jgi:adenylate kinase family enzyme
MTDVTLVDLVAKRINMKDCMQNGWLLDGFPQTRQQAKLLLNKGINPTNVFNLQLPIEKCYERSMETSNTNFSSIRTILSRRLATESKSCPEVAYFYQKYYNSLTTIDGMRSRW